MTSTTHRIFATTWLAFSIFGVFSGSSDAQVLGMIAITLIHNNTADVLKHLEDS